MKTTISAILCILFLSVFSGCSESRQIGSLPSLYKTSEGKTIAYESYDNALKLFNCEFEENYIETDFGITHLLAAGDENAQALILLPGLFGDATMWYPNVGELSEHFRVYALDMINYGGKSQALGNPVQSIEDYTLWFQQICNHLNIEKVAVGGVSYGSWLALSLARELPNTIGALALLDPSETFMPMNGGIAWKGFKAFMFFPNREKYHDFFNWIGGGYMDDNMAIWFEHMLDVIEYGSTKMTDVPRHHTYSADALTMLKMPVLVLAGGKPILYRDPEEFKANAQKAIPHAQVVIVEGAGHGLNQEKSDYINATVIEFLEAEF